MTEDQFSLAGQTAVVTGGSRGIGEAIAVAMAEAGADVVPVARSEDALRETVDRVEATGSDSLFAPCDVTDRPGVRSLFEAVRDELGPVDTLVNNAGTNPFFGDPTDLDADTFERILAVNVQGAFTCAKAFGRDVFDRDGTGVLLNVSSVGGVIALPYQAPYTASKHALNGLTKSLAVDWAPEVRVNAIAPGYVKTEFTAGVRDNDDIRADILDGVPQERFAEPEEIAGSAVYLASDAASYVTGEIHLVDGGMAAE